VTTAAHLPHQPIAVVESELVNCRLKVNWAWCNWTLMSLFADITCRPTLLVLGIGPVSNCSTPEVHQISSKAGWDKYSLFTDYDEKYGQIFLLLKNNTWTTYHSCTCFTCNNTVNNIDISSYISVIKLQSQNGKIRQLILKYMKGWQSHRFRGIFVYGTPLLANSPTKITIKCR